MRADRGRGAPPPFERDRGDRDRDRGGPPRQGGGPRKPAEPFNNPFASLLSMKDSFRKK